MSISDEAYMTTLINEQRIRTHYPNIWAVRGKELIDKEYSRLQKVEDVCTKLGISASHFRDLFHMAYGVTPKSYLIQVKVEAAVEYLMDESAAVGDVAVKVGIPQRTVFNRTFKNYVGVSPMKFQGILLRGEIDTRKCNAKRIHEG
jgi:AraC-like DNA-binding protein